MKTVSARMILGMLALLAIAMPAAATEVHAFLDRSTVHLGETVTLNVEVEGDASVNAPDFSALEPDFVLSGTSRNQSVRIVNGNISRKTLFAVALKPRRQGTLTIPALDVAGAKTKPLTLTVLPPDMQASATPGDAVFVRMRIEPDTAWVGQQLRLVVQLYYRGGNLQGKLADPVIAGADVSRMGQQSQYRAQAGGYSYQVVERDYSVVPQQAGTLTVPPVRFDGQLGTGPAGFGNIFGRGQQVRVQSGALEVQVKPRPAGYGQGTWLPARNVTLDMDGMPPDGKASVGQPFTLTVTIHASGIDDTVLPDISLPDIPGANVYPDKAQGETDRSGPWLASSRTRKFAIVPTQPGTLEIPALALDWFDVLHGETKTARVDGATVTVTAASVSASSAPAVPASAPAHEAGAPAPAASVAGGARGPVMPVAGTEHGWRLAAILFLLLWLLTLLAWFVSRKWLRRSRSAAVQHRQADDAGSQRRAFQKAGDSDAQARLLLAWVRAERPQLHSLGAAAAQLGDPEQARLMRAMDEARFGDGEIPDVDTVRQAFAGTLAWQPPARVATDGLPPLYP